MKSTLYICTNWGTTLNKLGLKSSWNPSIWIRLMDRLYVFTQALEIKALRENKRG